ncbi:MAG: hypothetical protein MGAcid_20190 [uncultured Acidilobus sp. MG]|nr:MAG: hypothetical protein MGAcid_20190 [uncultured Acidilobus sp. MG]
MGPSRETSSPFLTSRLTSSRATTLP